MTTTFELAGRTALVTGAARGIGAAIVERFRASGAGVVAVDVRSDSLQERYAGTADVLTVAADVVDPGACADAVAAAVRWGGQLDILVNNAGITRDRMVWKMSDGDWDAVLGVHLTGTFNLIRGAIPVMRERGRGRIVNITSNAGITGNIGQANYSAAKAGIVGLTRTVAREVAPFGITVNAVAPAAETDMVAAIPPERKQRLVDKIPMGRLGRPEETARAVAFLAADDAGYITGVTLPVDGGLAM